LQEHKTLSHVKKSPVKCGVVKLGTEISSQLSATQLSGDLSSVLANRPQHFSELILT